MNSKWMTTRDTAALLGVSRQRVSQLIHSGALVAQRFGHMWMVRRDSARRRLQRFPLTERNR